MYKCECGKEFENKQSYCGHCGHCKTHRLLQGKPTLNSNFRFRKGKPSWNKGLTKEIDERVKAYALKCSKTLKGISTHKQSEESRLKISNTMKNNPNCGGYRKGSGRGKKGWYDGVFFDSQWELAFWIYCKDHKIPIRKNTKKFYYKINGKEHYYLPDFVVNDNQITEIKGYKTELSEMKKDLVKDIKILYRSDLKYVFDYMKSEYNLKENEIYTLYNNVES